MTPATSRSNENCTCISVIEEGGSTYPLSHPCVVSVQVGRQPHMRHDAVFVRKIFGGRWHCGPVAALRPYGQ